MRNHKNIGQLIYNKNTNKEMCLDFQILVNDTVLCIESDQDKYKNYSANDCDQINYHKITTANKYKYIFIRYNPDTYITNNIIFDPPKETRFMKLSEEINIHVTRIKNNQNIAKCEIFYLYYDGYDNGDIKKSIINEIMNEKNDSDYITIDSGDSSDEINDDLSDDSNNDSGDEINNDSSDELNNCINNDVIQQNTNIIIKKRTNKKKTYDCNKCDKSFNFKSDLDRHMNRKISCNIDEKNAQIQIKKTCVYCNKILTRIDSMPKHLTFCKEKQINDKKKDDEQIIIQLTKEIHEIKQYINNNKKQLNY